MYIYIWNTEIYRYFESLGLKARSYDLQVAIIVTFKNWNWELELGFSNVYRTVLCTVSNRYRERNNSLRKSKDQLCYVARVIGLSLRVTLLSKGFGSESGLKVERSGGVGSSTGESKKLHALNPHLSFAWIALGVILWWRGEHHIRVMAPT
jgi:hypothetical protein